MSNQVQLERWEIERLIDFFWLLDHWDRRQNAGTKEKHRDHDSPKEPVQTDQGS